MKKSWNGVRDAIRAAASSPEGCGISEVPGMTPGQIMNNVRRLVEGGGMFTVGYRSERRYFVNKADADRYQAEVLPLIQQQKKDKRKKIHNARMVAKRAATPKAQKPPKEAKPGRHPKPPKQQNPPKPPKAAKAAEVGVKIKTPTKVQWANKPVVTPAHVKVQHCPSPPHFGPAARLRNVPFAQQMNNLPALKVGDSL